MILARVILSCTFGAAMALLLVAAGCASSPTAPTNYAPFSQTDLRSGTGAEAVAGVLVTVNYTGWFYDATRTDQKGLQFDSTMGGEAFTFTLGASEVISGWDQGIVGMKVGGLRRLVIPPSLGYGAKRVASIPPNATLMYEVELLNVDAQ